MHAPHTSEVPFIFGTTAAAAAQLGTGSDIGPMTRVMMATWAAFARHGNPDNPTLPEWKPFKDNDRQTMVLNVESRLAIDPGAEARAALSSLPYFGYITPTRNSYSIIFARLQAGSGPTARGALGDSYSPRSHGDERNRQAI